MIFFQNKSSLSIKDMVFLRIFKDDKKRPLCIFFLKVSTYGIDFEERRNMINIWKFRKS